MYKPTSLIQNNYIHHSFYVSPSQSPYKEYILKGLDVNIKTIGCGYSVFVREDCVLTQAWRALTLRWIVEVFLCKQQELYRIHYIVCSNICTHFRQLLTLCFVATYIFFMHRQTCQILKWFCFWITSRNMIDMCMLSGIF